MSSKQTLTFIMVKCLSKSLSWFEITDGNQCYKASVCEYWSSKTNFQSETSGFRKVMSQDYFLF
jgi:hypothetical protein